MIMVMHERGQHGDASMHGRQTSCWHHSQAWLDLQHARVVGESGGRALAALWHLVHVALSHRHSGAGEVNGPATPAGRRMGSKLERKLQLCPVCSWCIFRSKVRIQLAVQGKGSHVEATLQEPSEHTLNPAAVPCNRGGPRGWTSSVGLRNRLAVSHGVCATRPLTCSPRGAPALWSRLPRRPR